MSDLSIYVIRHSLPTRKFSGSLKSFVVEGESLIGARFASMNAYWSVAQKLAEDPTDIVGFFGYRKYMNFRDEGDTWHEVSPQEFDTYHEWLLNWDGEKTRQILQSDDIIVTASYPLVTQGGLSNDFINSRSPEDWKQFRKIMEQHGEWEWDMDSVTSHFFLTTRIVFDNFMSEWWEVFRDLYPLIHSEDAKANRPYSTRALDFLSERFFTLWLRKWQRMGLKSRVVPLMICWSAA